MSATIIYYSSNKEDEVFEQKVIDSLLSVAGSLPIISVTQKPLNLGHNICVGDVGASNFNLYRQVQMACERANTEYVISAEADCLYGADYFLFRPNEKNRCFRNSNIFILNKDKGLFLKKTCSVFSQIVDREYYLALLKDLYANKPMWDEQNKKWPGEVFPTWKYFSTEIPCLSFKTGDGLRKMTQVMREGHTETLPYWGNMDNLRRKLF